MSNYSERISRLLAENSLTLADFCKKIGLNSTTTIAKIVSENRKPSSKTIGRIINAYPNISYEWLTTGRGEMKTGSGKTTNNLPKSLSGNDDLTVTAKQVINQLDINNLHYSAMLEKKLSDDREHYNSVTELNTDNHSKHIADLLEGYKSLEDRLETKLQGVEAGVTKQILKKLAEDRDYYNNVSDTSQNIKNILEAFNMLESKVEAQAEKASLSVNNKLDSIFKNYNKTYLVALDKILRIEQDLENINTFMAQAFETEKIKSKLKIKSKTKRNERT